MTILKHHHLRSGPKRALYSFILIGGMLLAGTCSLHSVEGYSFLDAFYATTMIVTAQGPSLPPKTSSGKLIESLLALLSVGVGVTAIGFLFGPLLGRLWRIGAKSLDDEMETLNLKQNSSNRPSHK